MGLVYWTMYEQTDSKIICSSITEESRTWSTKIIRMTETCVNLGHEDVYTESCINIVLSILLYSQVHSANAVRLSEELKVRSSWISWNRGEVRQELSKTSSADDYALVNKTPRRWWQKERRGLKEVIFGDLTIIRTYYAAKYVEKAPSPQVLQYSRHLVPVS